MPDLCWISSLRLECNQWKLKIELKEAFVWDLRKFQKVTKINLMTTEEQENCILLFHGKMYLFYFCIWIFLSFCLCTLFWHISHYGALWTLLRWKQIHKVSFLKKGRWASHLLMLMMVVVTRRSVRCSRKVVRSITLVVHHIQAAHSDEAQFSVRSSRRRQPRSLLRFHRGCTPGAVGASIYAQTHTMAMPSDNAPPAAHCAADTPGYKMDRNVIKCILKMEETNISDRSSGRFWLRTDCVQPPDSVFFGGELYLERAGALYARPPGKGLHGAVEFNTALTPAANLGLCDWFSFIKANVSMFAGCLYLWVTFRWVTASSLWPLKSTGSIIYGGEQP